MYTQHFGLKKAVFDGGIAQGDDLFLGPRQRRVAANLKVGLTTRDSIVTLTGRLGVGKTTIASEALRITATRLAQTWVGNTPLAPDEMLELLLAGFEFTPYDMGRVQRLHTWRQYMAELSVTDTRICILVENAFALGPEALQALEALTAADPNNCPGANLVLMGPASLHELLETPDLAPLKQRIRSTQRLDPLTPQEVEQYLRHRITIVGGDYDTIFAPATTAMIHCFSAGVPRVINNVCETALTVAATRKATQITAQLVQRVAEGVYGLTPSVQLPEAAVAPASVRSATPAAAVKSQAKAPAPPADPAPAEDPQAPVDAAVRVEGAHGSTNAEALVDDSEAPVDAAVLVEGAHSSIDAEALVDDAEAPVNAKVPIDAAQAPVDAAVLAEGAHGSTNAEALVDDAEAPVDGRKARVEAADAKPQQAPAVSATTRPVQGSPEPPVLTDAVDVDLPSDGEHLARHARPLAATLPPKSAAQPDEKPQSEVEDFEDFAAATHLHQLSDSMAERLFSEEQALTIASLLEADAPLESSDIELSAEATAAVLQLEEDFVPERNEDNAEPKPDGVRVKVAMGSE